MAVHLPTSTDTPGRMYERADRSWHDSVAGPTSSTLTVHIWQYDIVLTQIWASEPVDVTVVGGKLYASALLEVVERARAALAGAPATDLGSSGPLPAASVEINATFLALGLLVLFVCLWRCHCCSSACGEKQRLLEEDIERSDQKRPAVNVGLFWSGSSMRVRINTPRTHAMLKAGEQQAIGISSQAVHSVHDAPTPYPRPSTTLPPLYTAEPSSCASSCRSDHLTPAWGSTTVPSDSSSHLTSGYSTLRTPACEGPAAAQPGTETSACVPRILDLDTPLACTEPPSAASAQRQAGTAERPRSDRLINRSLALPIPVLATKKIAAAPAQDESQLSRNCLTNRGETSFRSGLVRCLSVRLSQAQSQSAYEELPGDVDSKCESARLTRLGKLSFQRRKQKFLTDLTA